MIIGTFEALDHRDDVVEGLAQALVVPLRGGQRLQVGLERGQRLRVSRQRRDRVDIDADGEQDIAALRQLAQGLALDPDERLGIEGVSVGVGATVAR